MTTLFARIRIVVVAIAVLVVAAIATPASAQQQVNPTASAVQEEQLLQLQRVQGRISIPDDKAAVLIQPAGQAWRHFHEVTLRWIGGIAISGMFGLLVVFLVVRGRIRLASGFSGRTIMRFNTFERFVHWMTAACFIVLGITGLNITFGKTLLLPLIGLEMFAAFSQWGKYAHNYLSFPFTLGVLFIFLIWLKDNIPDKVDVEWLKAGGGLVGSAHPPAKRFNAGQKVIYWVVVFGGTAVAVSGYFLMFPFYETGIRGMQTSEVVHGVVAMLFVAAMLAHIYIGTVGMEGAFDAMGTGEVDLNWAKEHHSLWVEEEAAKGRVSTPPANASLTRQFTSL
jgi:formate dehydrogenase subunit gamma